jgi:hypothetical protein
MSIRPKQTENENAGIKAYMDLMGVTESQARSVYMYVGCNPVTTSDARSPKMKPANPLFH